MAHQNNIIRTADVRDNDKTPQRENLCGVFVSKKINSMFRYGIHFLSTFSVFVICFREPDKPLYSYVFDCILTKKPHRHTHKHLPYEVLPHLVKFSGGGGG